MSNQKWKILNSWGSVNNGILSEYFQTPLDPTHLSTTMWWSSTPASRKVLSWSNQFAEREETIWCKKWYGNFMGRLRLIEICGTSYPLNLVYDSTLTHLWSRILDLIQTKISYCCIIDCKYGKPFIIAHTVFWKFISYLFTYISTFHIHW